LFIDDKSRPLCDALEPNEVFIERPIGSRNLFIEIAQQREVVPFFRGPGVKGKRTIDSDGHDLRVLVLQRIDVVSHGAQLLRSPTSKSERREQEHSILLALQVAEFEVLHLIGL
jgi:hypothetical protein